MIRDYQTSDAVAVLELNADNVPEVGVMDQDKLELLVACSPCFKVLELDGEVAGMLIVLEEGARYPSLNYGWFSERLDAFAYVDRVALGETARGQGWGPAFYEVANEWALGAGKPVICAEVNTLPPNPRSLRFHDINGFKVTAHTRPYGEDEEVAMLQKDLSNLVV